jgi:glycine/D-amino acid oxidase-like deaminating enzyme
VLFEPPAGVLHARRATQLLVEDGERRGVRRVAARATPAGAPEADVVVWACGAWLPALFPELVPVVVERRDVFFFGGDAAWADTPGFVEYDLGFYGHGDVGGLGVKVAPDDPSEPIDPDTLERVPLDERLQAARAYAARRSPALASAPLLGARVCQYDLSADTHFVVDRHPERPSWWLVGGGSGHGFKHGPALAEYVSDCIEGAREPEPFHLLGPRAGDAGLRTGAGL